MNAKPIELTEREREELYTSCISMWSRLKKDKHVTQAELDFWYNLGEKLRKAKI